MLRAARDAGARRVVLTSSFAAVGYSPKPGAEYTEADWTDPDTPGLPPYPRSKAIAERAAWDFIEREGGDTELVVVNPTFILGPPLTPQLRSSLQLIKAMLDGTMPVAADASASASPTCATWPTCTSGRWPRLRRPGSATWLWPTARRSASCELAQILRERLGPLAERVPTEEAPGDGAAPADHPQRPGQAGARLAPAPGRDHDRGDRREPARPRPAGETMTRASAQMAWRRPGRPDKAVLWAWRDRELGMHWL